MSSPLTIPVTAVSVQSAKPSTKFGLQSTVPISNLASVLMRAALTEIPDDAVITSATLVPAQYKAWSGSRTLKAQANTGKMSTASTWNSKPTTTATNEATQTRSGAAAASLWSLDVQAIVSAWHAGSLVNNGFTLSTTSTTASSLRSTNATGLPPVLIVEYTEGPTVPTGLHPSDSGVVSIAKPTLTAQVASDTISIQVQIDAAANAVSPAFDSGEVSTPAGLLNLTTTAYAGLSNAASTQWRMRAKNPQGWSGWSSWVTFSRQTWGTLTITSPTSTSEDDSPVVASTYSGTVTAWQAETQLAGGTTLEASGWTPDNTMAWGSTKSVGAAGVAVMRIRDNFDRVATPGDPDYKTATQAFTVAASGVPTIIASFTVSQTSPRPAPHLAGTRAAVPDFVDIKRNGVRIDRVPGADVFSGTAFGYDDLTAPMNTAATYTVTAIVNGAFSNPSSSVTLTPTCGGIWLYDTEDGSEVVVWGDADADQEQPEVAILHTPVSGPDGAPQVVRRRLARYPRQGALPQGSVLKDVTFGAGNVLTAADSEANLRAWAEQDAGHLYRLVMGNQNDQVILGDITFAESPLNLNGERVLPVAANWWAQG